MLTKNVNSFGKNFQRILAMNYQKFKQEDNKAMKEMFLLAGLMIGGLYFTRKERKAYAWIYRDDIGAPAGIHGYEEQVNSVGQHHGHTHWVQEARLGTFDSATVRRGFKVWLKSCQSCHGAYKQKYDIMVDKVFDQQELIVTFILTKEKNA